jgi:hypothetical protein
MAIVWVWIFGLPISAGIGGLIGIQFNTDVGGYIGMLVGALIFAWAAFWLGGPYGRSRSR